ncbi:SDR family oxidoreductase [uncultured Chitinophaga sp.]|uniref:SDR family oxidoreductase n=1 Tax=uncultured Chitinophaga sp. TaxID=339340 RepID=UPI0025DD1317|nr:SDR family oxidoreductase [uncultured Chitinophaga sp.]
MEKIALVVGVTGIAGNNLAKQLLNDGWTTYGIARNPEINITGMKPLAVDLLDVAALQTVLHDINPTHVFFTTWMRRESEEENIKVNATLVRNLLEVLSPKKSVQHVALVTGLKHYLGPFEAYANTGTLPATPIREEQPRLSYPNFYYAQEDEVYAAAARDGFTWSIHRPHTIIGSAVGNLMNMGTTLAVYASICKQTGEPFTWPGSEAQWNGVSDLTDARILAKQLVWAASTPAAANTAFNIANGDVFRWSWLWPKIAEWFGVSWEGFAGKAKPLQQQMQGDAGLWRTITIKHGLVEDNLVRLVSPWHTDLDLGRPIEVMTDMANSRNLGFSAYQDTRHSFFDLFEELRRERIIP